MESEAFETDATKLPTKAELEREMAASADLQRRRTRPERFDLIGRIMRDHGLTEAQALKALDDHGY